jgi:hypothetical protein
MGELVVNNNTQNVPSNTEYVDYDFIGTEYYYANYNPYGGYQCCKTIVYHVFLNSNKYHQSATPNIPQVSFNEQLLFIHLFIGDEQFNVTNADNVKITFECDGEVIEGDPERFNAYNPYRGTFTYILNQKETHNVGLNTLTIEVTMGSETVKFTTCYNIVANVTIGNIDGMDYQGMTLQDLVDIIKEHIENTDIHCDEFKNMNISRAFITLDDIDDLDLLDKTKLVNGKMFRINTDPVSYYYFDSNDQDFKPLVF